MYNNKILCSVDTVQMEMHAYMPTLETKSGWGSRVCSVKSLNIVWKNHEKMEISILHIYKSNLGPSNSDGSNLFESPANFPYIFKLKKIFRSNTDTPNSRT